MDEKGLLFSIDSMAAFLLMMLFLSIAVNAIFNILEKQKIMLKEFDEKQQLLFLADASAKKFLDIDLLSFDKNSKIILNDVKDCKTSSLWAERIIIFDNNPAILKVGFCE
ncbi:MAG: hypothetical protein COT15_00975 [Candidatus Diapherotrites archaeon CG08_land_8_20_14_0_20_34_12]|nr:MAG: hypothetical protein COT15_00975 [Candidatus Diapherotrites archaeon CG08_land_8_20_14_0_20_34_12]